MIKKLDWETLTPLAEAAEGLDGYYTVFEDNGCYTVFEGNGSHCASYLDLSRIPHAPVKLYSGDSVGEAKAACQKHHNKQVREILEDLLDFTSLREAASIERRMELKRESDYQIGYEDGRLEMACDILLGLEGLR